MNHNIPVIDTVRLDSKEWTTLCHRITESQVGRDLRNHLVQPFWEEHSLDKMAQHPVQTTLEGVQRGRVNHFPGEIIPVVTVLTVNNSPLV